MKGLKMRLKVRAPRVEGWREGKAEGGGEEIRRHRPVLAAYLEFRQEFVLTFINQELRVYSGG